MSRIVCRVFVVTIIQADQVAGTYDFVLVGTGFGSLFFAHKLLDVLPSTSRLLFLERGRFREHAIQVAEDRNGDAPVEAYVDIEDQRKKNWRFTIALGGGTLCWWGKTPRFHPSSFNLYSKHGIGRDWPFTYEELESYYCDAEHIIGVSGDSDDTSEFPRSRPYPFPPHVLSTPDRVMKAANPGHLIALPSARPSVHNDRRARCCSNGVCGRCPIDSKFTALNGMTRVLDDPRISIVLEACVTQVDIANRIATGVVFVHNGREQRVAANHVVLGANALFNPVILAHSGLAHPLLGRRLNEQIGHVYEVHLDKIDALDGGSVGTSMYIAGIDPVDRAVKGSFVYYFDNRWQTFGLRADPVKARRVFPLVEIVEEEPQFANHVDLARPATERPHIRHLTASDYGKAGLKTSQSRIESILAPLGVEKIGKPLYWNTLGHVEGTTVMGSNPDNAVVDSNQLHHTVRNLSVVGTSVLPTCGNYAPSLTAAAMSLRAADRLTRKGAA
jgi:choline dehydrogenase-like flavoprotein